VAVVDGIYYSSETFLRFIRRHQFFAANFLQLALANFSNSAASYLFKKIDKPKNFTAGKHLSLCVFNTQFITGGNILYCGRVLLIAVVVSRFKKIGRFIRKL